MFAALSFFLQFQLQFLIAIDLWCLTKYIDSTWLNPEYKIWFEALRDFVAVEYLWSHMSINNDQEQNTCFYFIHNKNENLQKKKRMR